METLYDLLGALPDDGADDLRAAFRSAVKRAHPDVNPGDPDAELKLRRILRANEILSDVEQRAAYDRLLALAYLEQKRAVTDRVYKLASGVMAMAAGSAVAVGGYALLLQLSANALAPAITAPEAANEPAAIVAGGPAGDKAASVPAAPPEASQHADVTTPAIVVATESAPNVVTPPARFRSSLGRRPKRAPKFASAYTDRSIMFYHLRKFARAFAESAPANAYPGNVYHERAAPRRRGYER
jgi:curved DNA-binding protein CbpA